MKPFLPKPCLLAAAAALLLCALAAGARDADLPTSAFGILSRRCLVCHGSVKQSGLDLRTRESAMRGGARGPAVTPGKPDESRMLRLIAGENGLRMPPAAPLPAPEREVLRRWIAAGAAWPAQADGTWWSLRPIRRPPAPAVKARGWVRNPIDAFVLAKLEAKGLRPAPAAGRRELIRRLSFDLTGLPPTPEEAEQFAADRSPDAYEQLVERLLASPRYGERWARHWLDVVRFAESQGFERDKIRDHAWRYRDYVIRAFNSDLPYDRFVREQVAGDVLPGAAPETIPATGFLVAGPWDEVGNQQPSLVMRRRVRQDELEDIIAAVGQTFLGLSVNCARCHDHKFDPIPQRDYYRLQAALAGVRHGDRFVLPPGEARERQQAIEALEKQVADLNRRIVALNQAATMRARQQKTAPPTPAEIEAARTPEERAEAAAITKKVGELNAELAGRRSGPQVYAACPGPMEPVHVLDRGDIEKPKEPVTPGGLAAVPGPASDFGLASDAPDAERRMKLADWLTDSANPLTPRVMVNRVWHYHFGRGLVGSPSDFGANGERPSHPELLDWLAGYFVGGVGSEVLGLRGAAPNTQHLAPNTHGPWSIKSLHRLIVTSNTYKQSARANPQAAAVDGENLLLWRMSPRRLEAEEIRDAMLAVSGQLNLSPAGTGGPGFRPFSVYVNNSHFYTYEDRVAPEYQRRSVYRTVVNSGGIPLLETFDCPDPSVKTPRRSSTITPLQALSLLNNSFVLRQARETAKRIETEAGADPARQVDRAYRLALSRPPKPAELARGARFVRGDGLAAFCRVLFNANEFVFVR